MHIWRPTRALKIFIFLIILHLFNIITCSYNKLLSRSFGSASMNSMSPMSSMGDLDSHSIYLSPKMLMQETAEPPSQAVQMDAQCLCPVSEPKIKYIAVPMPKLPHTPTTTPLPPTAPPPPPPPITTLPPPVTSAPCTQKPLHAKRQIITIQELPMTGSSHDGWR